MKDYRVSFEIDVSANTRKQAARLAWKLLDEAASVIGTVQPYKLYNPPPESIEIPVPKKRYFILSPDDLPVDIIAYPSKAAAVQACKAWAKRYREQGYYKTSDGSRIPFFAIADACRIVEHNKQ